jgi:hypothetical protein
MVQECFALHREARSRLFVFRRTARKRCIKSEVNVEAEAATVLRVNSQYQVDLLYVNTRVIPKVRSPMFKHIK